MLHASQSREQRSSSCASAVDVEVLVDVVSVDAVVDSSYFVVGDSSDLVVGESSDFVVGPDSVAVSVGP